DRRPEHDAFGLAVLIFQLLMQGVHPFSGRLIGAGEPPGLAERIAAGHWPYAQKRIVPYVPSPLAPPFAIIPPLIRQLMCRCFEEGHGNPAARPNAAEWQQALKDAEAQLATCPTNPQHLYHGGLSECPWCRIAQTQHRDVFPSREEIAAQRASATRLASSPSSPGGSLPGPSRGDAFAIPPPSPHVSQSP